MLWDGRVREALDVARSRLAGATDPARRAELRWVLAYAELAVGDVDQALRTIERAGAEAPPAPWPDRLTGLEALGRILAGDLDGVLRIGAELEGRTDLDGLARVYLLHVHAVVGYLTRDLDGMHARLDEAERIPAYDDDPGQQAMAMLLRVAGTEPGSPEVARLLDRSEDIARRVGASMQSWWWMSASLARYNAGEWDAALLTARDGLAQVDDALARPLHALVVMISLHRGELEPARAHAAALEMGPPTRGVMRFYEAFPVLAGALVAEADGELGEAVAAVRLVVEGKVGVHRGSHVAGLGARMVRIALAAGDLALAEAIVSEMEASGPEAQANAVLGRALLAGDRVALIAARDALVEAGAVLESAWADEELARQLAAEGRHQDARAVFGPVGERFRSLRAVGELDRAEAVMRRHGVRFGVRGPRSRPSTGWESLTDAELRVAMQVARGSTNPEIGHALHVSPRTVQSHVSRILAKLDLGTRAELAAEVARRG